MTTTYPGTLDAFTNPTSADTLDNPSHADQHANINDAMEAVQAELGTDPSGSSSTVKARLDLLAGIHSFIRVRRSTSSQTIANNTNVTAILNNSVFLTEDSDDFSHNASTGVITINTTGIYIVTWGSQWVSNSTGTRRASALWKAGGTGSGAAIGQNVMAASAESIHSSATAWEFTAGDTVEMLVHQNSGGNLDLAADNRTYLSLLRLA